MAAVDGPSVFVMSVKGSVSGESGIVVGVVKIFVKEKGIGVFATSSGYTGPREDDKGRRSESDM